jgi:hypothetical protein
LNASSANLILEVTERARAGKKKAPPVRTGLSREANYRNVPSVILVALTFNRAEGLAADQKNYGPLFGHVDSAKRKAPPKRGRVVVRAL